MASPLFVGRLYSAWVEQGGLLPEAGGHLEPGQLLPGPHLVAEGQSPESRVQF